MSAPYGVLSKFYSRLIGGSDYDEWTDYVVSLVEKYAPEKHGADLACGSGTVTRKLFKSGFSVIGSDISADMLRSAEEENVRNKTSVKYILADMKTLRLFDKAAFITAVNDGLNYVFGKDLLKTFKNFNKNLIKGGVIVFDISTEYKLKTLIDGEMYGSNGEDLSYMWFSDYDDKKNVVNYTLTFFEKNGNYYSRYDEYDEQFVHSVNDIKSALSGAGFSILLLTDEKGGEFTDKSSRAVFVAEKL